MDILSLRLPAPDLAAPRAFYETVLGLPIVAHTAELLTVAVGASTLTYVQRDDVVPCHVAFDIPRNKVVEARRWLGERTALLALDGQDVFHGDDWNATMMYFLDPAGHILELVARHTLPNDADGAFDERLILSISESGIVVDDVRLHVDALATALGLGPYHAQSSAFAPRGDEHGLLIVVQNGRHWFPTQTPARPCPVHAVVRCALDGQYDVPDAPYSFSSPHAMAPRDGGAS